MLPDTAESVPEIMQTEDTGPDEIPILNPLPDTAMTVKEEIDQSLASPEDKTSTLMECSSADTTSSFSGVAQCSSIVKDAEIGNEVKNPCDRIGPNEEPFLRDPTLNNILSMTGTSNSLISSLPCISSLLSAPYKIEKDKSRGKRRSRLKLKFHHQALPPEYLDHYAATVSQQKTISTKEVADRVDVKGREDHQLVLQNAGSTITKRSEKKHMIISSPPDGFIKVEQEISKDIMSPIVEGTIMNHFDSLPMQPPLVGDDDDSNNVLLNELTNINKVKTPCGIAHVSDETCVSGKGLLGTLLSGTKTSGLASKLYDDNEKKRNPVITSSNAKNKISNISQISSCNNAADGEFRSFQDLPYMGEITLDSMKPRRGRKPKKADICHLIYKNYGTAMFPGNSSRNDAAENEELPATKIHGFYNSTSVSQIYHTDNDLKKESIYESSLKCGPESLEIPSPASHSDVQNRIMSSLLEKRLMTSQDVKQLTRPCCKSNLTCLTRSDGNVIQEGDLWRENFKSASSLNDEPLNLCVKDLNQLKIRLLRKHGNFYEPKTCDVIKSEAQSPNSCQETDECKLNYECPMKFRQETNVFGGSKENKNDPHVEMGSRRKPFSFSDEVCPRSSNLSLLSSDHGTSKNSTPLSGGYVYWPSAGIFVHPMALQSQFLYYQNMGTIPVVPISPTESQSFIPPNVPQVNLVSHINTVVQIPPVTSSKKISKKNSQSPINKISIPKTSPMTGSSSKPNSSICTNDSFGKLKRLAPSANIPTTSAPVKRKRSAIFIPPIPKENSSNPTTEVSICKFKFTGGAKPSLQEKKMLSVDSGGNFRYYSGTGDKSMRGYEFFPRETLQQTGQAVSSSPEQFLSAYKSGGTERAISTTLPLTSDKKSKNFQFISELAEESSKYDITCTRTTKPEDEKSYYAFLKYDQPNDRGGTSRQNITTSVDTNAEDNLSISKYSSIEKDQEEESVSNAPVRLRKKRKTRKTLAREKLEQTFKEKGFLIQTQQLESAEGATYCKFRQLRKFTRYLFRSWKDYLPGNVREMSVAAGVAVPEISSPTQDSNVSPDIEGEFTCSKSPIPSFQPFPPNSKTFPSS